MKTVNFKNVFIAALLMVAMITPALMAQSRNDKMREREEKNYRPLEKKTYVQLCMRYDDDEWYAASGFVRILMGGKDAPEPTVVINKLLHDCQMQLKAKIKGRLQQVTREYCTQVDIDSRSSTGSLIESESELVVDQMIDDTREDCREMGDMDEAGYRILYMGIIVKKSDIIDKLVDGMQESKTLSSDEKEKLRQNESKFRESAFKVFDKDKNMSHE